MKKLQRSQDQNIDKIGIPRSSSVDVAEKTENWGGQLFVLSMQSLTSQQEQIQKKVFTRWLNSKLKTISPPMIIQDIYSELADGIAIIRLLEILANTKLPIENHPNMNRVHHISNHQIALNFLRENDVKLVNINPTDLIEGRHSIILGLLWSIILRYQISRRNPGQSASVELKQKLKEHLHIHIPDFGPFWSDGTHFMELVHSFLPKEKKMDEAELLRKPSKELISYCFDSAEKQLLIPKLLEPEDVVENPDEKSIMAYISQFFMLSEQNASNQDLSELLSSFYDQINDLNNFLDSSDTSKNHPKEELEKIKNWLSKNLFRERLSKIISMGSEPNMAPIMAQKVIQAKNTWERMNTRIDNTLQNIERAVLLIENTKKIIFDTDDWMDEFEQLLTNLVDHEIPTAEYERRMKNFELLVKNFPAVYHRFNNHYKNANLALRGGVYNPNVFPLEELDKTNTKLEHINKTLKERIRWVSQMVLGMRLRDNMLEQIETIKNCRIDFPAQEFSNKTSLDKFVVEMQKVHKNVQKYLDKANIEISKADQQLNQNPQFFFLAKPRNLLSNQAENAHLLMMEQETKYLKVLKDWGHVESSIRDLQTQLGSVDQQLSAASGESGLKGLEIHNNTIREANNNLVEKIVPQIKLMRMTLNNVISNCSKEAVDKLENDYSRIQGVASIMQNRADNLMDINFETEEKLKEITKSFDEFDSNLNILKESFSKDFSTVNLDKSIEDVNRILNNGDQLKQSAINSEGLLMSIRDRLKPTDYKELNDKLKWRNSSLSSFQDKVQNRWEKLKDIKAIIAESDKMCSRINSYSIKIPKIRDLVDLRENTDLLKDKLNQLKSDESKLEEYEKALINAKDLCSDATTSRIKDCRDRLKRHKTILGKGIESFELADKKIQKFYEDFKVIHSQINDLVSTPGDDLDEFDLKRREEKLKNCISAVKNLMNECEDICPLMEEETSAWQDKCENILKTAQLNLKRVRGNIDKMETNKEREVSLESELSKMSEWVKTNRKNLENLSTCNVDDLMKPICALKLMFAEVGEKQKYLKLFQDEVRATNSTKLNKKYDDLMNCLHQRWENIKQMLSYLSTWKDYWSFRRHFIDTTNSWKPQIRNSSEPEVAMMIKYLNDFENSIQKWQDESSDMHYIKNAPSVLSSGNPVKMNEEITKNWIHWKKIKDALVERNDDLNSMANIHSQFEILKNELEGKSQQFSDRLTDITPKIASLHQMEKSLEYLNEFTDELLPHLGSLENMGSLLKSDNLDKLFAIHAKSSFRELQCQFNHIQKGKDQMEADLKEIIKIWTEEDKIAEKIQLSFPVIDFPKLNMWSNSGNVGELDDYLKNNYYNLDECDRNLRHLSEIGKGLENKLKKFSLENSTFDTFGDRMAEDLRKYRENADTICLEISQAKKLYNLIEFNNKWLESTQIEFRQIVDNLSFEDKISQLKKLKKNIDLNNFTSFEDSKHHIQDIKHGQLEWRGLVDFFENFSGRFEDFHKIINEKIDDEIWKENVKNEYNQSAERFYNYLNKSKEDQFELERMLNRDFEIKNCVGKIKNCDLSIAEGQKCFEELGERLVQLEKSLQNKNELSKHQAEYDAINNEWEIFRQKNIKTKEKLNKMIEKRYEIQEKVCEFNNSISKLGQEIYNIQNEAPTLHGAYSHIKKIKSFLTKINDWSDKTCQVGEEIVKYCPHNKLGELNDENKRSILGCKNSLEEYLINVNASLTRAEDFKSFLTEEEEEIQNIAQVMNQLKSDPYDIGRIEEIGSKIKSINDTLTDRQRRHERLVKKHEKIQERSPLRLEELNDNLILHSKLLKDLEEDNKKIGKKYDKLRNVSDEYTQKSEAIKAWLKEFRLIFQNDPNMACDKIGELEEEFDEMESKLDELYDDRFVKQLGTKIRELNQMRNQMKALSQTIKEFDELNRMKNQQSVEIMGNYAHFLEWMNQLRGEVESQRDSSSPDPGQIEMVIGEIESGEDKLNNLKKIPPQDLYGIDVRSAEIQYEKLLDSAKKKRMELKKRVKTKEEMRSELRQIGSQLDKLESDVDTMLIFPIKLPEDVQNMQFKTIDYQDKNEYMRERLGQIDLMRAKNEPNFYMRISNIDRKIKSTQGHLASILEPLTNIQLLENKIDFTVDQLRNFQRKDISNDSVDDLLKNKEDVDSMIKTATERIKGYENCWQDLKNKFSESKLNFGKEKKYPNSQVVDLLNEFDRKTLNMDNIIYKLEQFNKMEADIINFTSIHERKLQKLEGDRQAEDDRIKETLDSIKAYNHNVNLLSAIIENMKNMPIRFYVSSAAPENYNLLLSRAKKLYESHKKRIDLMKKYNMELDNLMTEIEACDPILEKSPQLRREMISKNIHLMANIGNRIEFFCEEIEEDKDLKELIKPKLEKVYEMYQKIAAKINKIQKIDEDEIIDDENLFRLLFNFYEYLTEDLHRDIEIIESAKFRNVEDAKKSLNTIISLMENLRNKKDKILKLADQGSSNSQKMGNIRRNAVKVCEIFQNKLENLKIRETELIEDWAKLEQIKTHLHNDLIEILKYLREFNLGNANYFGGGDLNSIGNQLLNFIEEKGKELNALDNAYIEFMSSHGNVECNGAEEEKYLQRSLLAQIQESNRAGNLKNTDTQTMCNVWTQIGGRNENKKRKRNFMMKQMIKLVRETHPKGEFDRKYGKILDLMTTYGEGNQMKVNMDVMIREYLSEI